MWDDNTSNEDLFRIQLPEDQGDPTTLASNPATIQNWYYPGNQYDMRMYQFKLIRAVLTANTFVSLPTGTGKTFIAAGLILNFYRWFPEGKIYFFAPTKPLVSQQLSAVQGILSDIDEEEMVMLTGETSARIRKSLYQVHRVFFMTAQTFNNDLNKKNVPNLDETCLLIFDEAHNFQIKNYYKQIVAKLSNESVGFRVLALSATPTNSMRELQRMIKDLNIAKFEYCDESDQDLAQYLHEKTVEKIEVQQIPEINEVLEKLDTVVQEIISTLVHMHLIGGNKFVPTKNTLLVVNARMQDEQQELINRHTVANYYGAIKRLWIAFGLLLCKERLIVQGISVFGKAFDAFKIKQRQKAQEKGDEETDIRNRMFGMQIWSDLEDAIEAAKEVGIDHPKLLELSNLLGDFFDQTPDSRAIVFAVYRDSTVNIAKHINDTVPAAKAQHFLGQNYGSGIRYTRVDQQNTINDFKSGKSNVLVSTSVGEEGIDIGEVDLIVLYDSVASGLRTVQRMGRTGRKRDGRVVVMTTGDYEAGLFDLGNAANKEMAETIKECSHTLKFYASNPRMLPASVESVQMYYEDSEPEQVAEIQAENGLKERTPSMECDNFEWDNSNYNDFGWDDDFFPGAELSSTMY